MSCRLRSNCYHACTHSFTSTPAASASLFLDTAAAASARKQSAHRKVPSVVIVRWWCLSWSLLSLNTFYPLKNLMKLNFCWPWVYKPRCFWDWVQNHHKVQGIYFASSSCAPKCLSQQVLVIKPIAKMPFISRACTPAEVAHDKMM